MRPFHACTIVGLVRPFRVLVLFTVDNRETTSCWMQCSPELIVVGLFTDTAIALEC